MPSLGLGLSLTSRGGPSDPNPAFVQQVVTGATPVNATSLVLTLSGVTTTAGNHLILVSAMRSGSVGGVTDSKGNTWQVDESVGVASASAGVASCKITTPLVNGDTITFAMTGGDSATGIAVNVAEFSGLSATGWADVQASAGGAAALAADSGAAASSANANALVIGVVGHVQSVTAFAPEVLSPIWNQGPTTASSGSSQTIHPMYRVVSSVGAYACKATWTVSTRQWAACVAVYK